MMESKEGNGFLIAERKKALAETMVGEACKQKLTVLQFSKLP